MRQARSRRGGGELVDAGEKVVVIMRRASAEGDQAALSANLPTFRDGKDVEMVHYPNADDARAAAGGVVTTAAVELVIKFRQASSARSDQRVDLGDRERASERLTGGRAPRRVAGRPARNESSSSRTPGRGRPRAGSPHGSIGYAASERVTVRGSR